MPEPTLALKLLGHTERDDGLIGRYHLEVTDTRSDRTVTISVEPRYLASARMHEKDPTRSVHILQGNSRRARSDAT